MGEITPPRRLALPPLRVYGLGFRVLGFRVLGLGFRVLRFRLFRFRDLEV